MMRGKPRSILFVPGHLWHLVKQATEAPCDVLGIDLEDGVPVSDKATARSNVEKYAHSPEISRHNLFVRINTVGSDWWRDDLRVAVEAGANGIWLPKCENAQTVVRVAEMLEWFESQRRCVTVAVETEVVPTLETPAGLLRAAEIAASHPRVRRITLGAYDLAFSMELPGNPVEAGRLTVPKWLVSMAAHAAEIQAIDSAYGGIGDVDALVGDARDAQRIGFTAKACIHPSHVRHINAVFTPSETEILAAKETLRAFRAGAADGSGVVMAGEQVIDITVAQQAEALLERAEEIRNDWS